MNLKKQFHLFGSPKYFYEFSLKYSGWLLSAALLFFVTGLIGGLILAPADYQQGESFRIIYVHVPSAWMSLFIYTLMAANAAILLIWRIKTCEIILRSSAVLGASFTFLALVTGSIWGKPMWGTWWVWDARLTSELILLFLYLGFIALQSAFEDRRVAARAGAILVLVGVVNIPIIKYSVEWWSTLHQPATISKLSAPSIHIDMLIPLLLMMIACMLYFFAVLLIRSRTEILAYESNATWVKDTLLGKGETS